MNDPAVRTRRPNDLIGVLHVVADAATDARDLAAVESAFRDLPPIITSHTELRMVARMWLEAAKVLRCRSLPRTTATLVAVVAAGRGFAARHARELISILCEGTAMDVPFYENAVSHRLGVRRRAPRA